MKTTKPTADELVLQLFATVKEKQAEIASSEKPRWETSCTIGTNPDTLEGRVNIQTVTDFNKLVDIYAFLLSKEDYWQKSVRELDVKVSFKWMGFGIDAWKRDIKARIALIGVSTKRKELEVLESRLNGLITVEQRRELELAEIQKILA